MKMKEATNVAFTEPSKIDLLKVNSRWVASVLTFGFSADVNTRANKCDGRKVQAVTLLQRCSVYQNYKAENWNFYRWQKIYFRSGFRNSRKYK